MGGNLCLVSIRWRKLRLENQMFLYCSNLRNTSWNYEYIPNKKSGSVLKLDPLKFLLKNRFKTVLWYYPCLTI